MMIGDGYVLPNATKDAHDIVSKQYVSKFLDKYKFTIRRVTSVSVLLFSRQHSRSLL
jgi:hypothetical protein